ncbi:MAG: hypothetical protein KAT17_06500, partial [Candidatus Aminicenantes bacterium]|nr:hypothetical protein [Candidatus Aminicenantes bacterium]
MIPGKAIIEKLSMVSPELADPRAFSNLRCCQMCRPDPNTSSPVFHILNFKSHAPLDAKGIFEKTFFSGDVKKYNNIKGQVQEESTSSVAGGASSSVDAKKERLRLSLNR